MRVIITDLLPVVIPSPIVYNRLIDRHQQRKMEVEVVHRLLVGPRTKFWVGISSITRASSQGRNSLGVPQEQLKGLTISQIEVRLCQQWRLVRVGKVKIWFEPI